MTVTAEPGGVIDTTQQSSAAETLGSAEPTTSGTGVPARGRWAVVRSWGAVLVLVLGCAAIATRQIDQRLEARRRLSLGAVRLSADAIDVISTSTGRVTNVAVQPQQRVRQNQVLVRIEATRAGRAGGVERGTVTAPVAGVTGSLLANVGASVAPGDVIARLYEPSRMYFRAKFPASRLTQIRIGMEARLVRVEPRLGEASDDEGEATLILVPEDQSKISDLVPGIAFTGWLRKGTAPPNAPSGLVASRGEG